MKTLKRIRSLVFPAMLVATLESVSAQQTLREQARQGSLEITILNEYDPVTLEQIAARSDTIVIGTVRLGRVSLSTNERELFTDYEISVERALKRTQGPGLAPGDLLVVRREGGVTQLEGNNVVATENDFPPFAIRGRYVLFLKTIPKEPYYLTVHGPQGAFAISNDSVRQVSEKFGSWNAERGTQTPLSGLIGEIQELLRKQ